MWVFIPRINPEFRQNRPAETISRNHALNCIFYHSLWVGQKLFFKRHTLDAPWKPSMPVPLFLRQLVTGDLDLLSIYHHYVIPRINMRRVLGLVLAPQSIGDSRGQSAKHLVSCINHIPIVVNILGADENCLHNCQIK